MFVTVYVLASRKRMHCRTNCCWSRTLDVETWPTSSSVPKPSSFASRRSPSSKPSVSSTSTAASDDTDPSSSACATVSCAWRQARRSCRWMTGSTAAASRPLPPNSSCTRRPAKTLVSEVESTPCAHWEACQVSLPGCRNADESAQHARQARHLRRARAQATARTCLQRRDVSANTCQWRVGALEWIAPRLVRRVRVEHVRRRSEWVERRTGSCGHGVDVPTSRPTHAPANAVPAAPGPPPLAARRQLPQRQPHTFTARVWRPRRWWRQRLAQWRRPRRERISCCRHLRHRPVRACTALLRRLDERRATRGHARSPQVLQRAAQRARARHQEPRLAAGARDAQWFDIHMLSCGLLFCRWFRSRAYCRRTIARRATGCAVSRCPSTRSVAASCSKPCPDARSLASDRLLLQRTASVARRSVFVLAFACTVRANVYF